MLGIVSYRLLPVSLMPDIDIPEITVHVSYPNSSARELENAVVKNLRMQLMQVTHLNNIECETSDGRSIIRIRFEYGTSIDFAFIEVNEKIDAAMNSLPRDMTRPRVIKASSTDLPVFYLNVSLKNDIAGSKVMQEDRFVELSEFCENVIRKRVEQLSQVAMIDMSGTIKPEIMIRPNRQKMESLNITNTQIEQAISTSNFSPGNIMVRDGFYQYQIRFTSNLKNPDDIGNIYIRSKDKVLQLKDIANIRIQPQKSRGMFITGNKQAITMAVIQQADARLEDLKSELSGLVDRFSKDYPELEFETAQDQTKLLDYTISNLRQDLIMGSILAFLVLFLFLSDIRAPLLIGITIPMSLVISFMFFKLFNLSINIISLSGLALGIGMIIDCSIIVIDNISQHHVRGLTILEACEKGTNEVIRPMLSSTLTTSSVFLPLIFLSGLAGALFYDEAVSVTIGNSASFIVAVTILPVMFSLLYKKRTRPVSSYSRNLQEKPMNSWKRLIKNLTFGNKLENWYEKGVEWVFSHQVISTSIFILLLVMSIVLFNVVKKEKLPYLTQNELIIDLVWNENIHLDENRRRVEELINSVSGQIQQSNSLIGEQEFILNREKDMDYYEAEIYLKLDIPEDVPLVEDKLRMFMQNNYPMGKISFRQPETIFERIFSGNEVPLIAKVSMSETGLLTADSVIAFVKDADNRLAAEIPNRVPLRQHLSIKINQEKLLLYNVDYSLVFSDIRTAFNENSFSVLRSYQRFMPIVLGDDSKLISDLLSVRKVRNKKGEEFPLNTFVTISREQDMKYITAGEQGEYIPLNYYASKDNIENYKGTLRQMVKERNFPDVQFAGSLDSNKKMFGELGIILIISLLLLYFILAAQFESLLQPLIVLLEVPADIAGALLMLWIFNSSLNIMSAIGIIVMTGVIINDSILKVDTINQYKRTGMPLREAIRTGGVIRLRSIIMTALTTIFGVLPFFFGGGMGAELQRPLSLALIGGMVFGTFVSLFFVPLVYWWIYKGEEKKQLAVVKE